MTKEQYDKVHPYKEICTKFAEKGAYPGGADGLFLIYKDEFNLGNIVKTNCPSCISSVLLDIHYKIENYEREM